MLLPLFLLALQFLALTCSFKKPWRNSKKYSLDRGKSLKYCLVKALFFLSLFIVSNGVVAQDLPQPERFDDLRLEIQAPSSEVAQSQERLENLRREIQKTSELLKLKESAQNDAAFAVKESQKAQKQLQKEIADLNGERNSLVKSTNAISREMKQGEKTYRLRKKQLSDLVAAQYLAGTPNYLAMIFKGSSPNSAARLHAYWQELSGAHTAAISEIKAGIQKQEDLANNLDKEKNRLNDLEKDLRQKEDAIKEEKKSREALLKRIKNEVADHQKTIAKLKRDEKNLSNLLNRLQKFSSPAPAAKFAKGQLIWPLNGRIEGRFGQEKLEGSTWQGVFIHSPQGTPVKAAAPGQVVFADWLRGFGMLVIVDHGSSYLSIYAHNDEILRDVGDNVTQGETIAYSGQNVENAQSGVYFEIRHQGKPMDPFLWIKK